MKVIKFLMNIFALILKAKYALCLVSTFINNRRISMYPV